LIAEPMKDLISLNVDVAIARTQRHELTKIGD
jgi:hypothetical protein